MDKRSQMFHSRVNLIDTSLINNNLNSNHDYLTMLDDHNNHRNNPLFNHRNEIPTISTTSTASRKAAATISGVGNDPSLGAGIIGGLTSSLFSAAAATTTTSPLVNSSWIVRDCPPSLRLLVKFYRFFGISFTGVVFVDSGFNKTFGLNQNGGHHTSSNNHNSSTKIYSNFVYNQPSTTTATTNSINKKKLYNNYHANDNYEQSFSARLQSYGYLMYNLLMLTLFLLILGRLVNDKYLNRMNDGKDGNQTMSNDTDLIDPSMVDNQTSLTLLPPPSSSLMDMNDSKANESLSFWDDLFRSINLSESHDQIRNLKPILSNIIDFLYIIVVLDELVPIIYLLIRGKNIINQLIRIPFIEQFDDSHCFIYRSLSIVATISMIINVIGFVSFNQNSKQILLDPDQPLSTRLFTLIAPIFNTILFIYLSVIPIMFIYTMMLFKFVIEKLLNTFAMVNLDEIIMLKLKTKLSDLNDQFKEIIPKFALPLTIHFATNIFMIISSACYLMIDLGPEGTTNTAFIFCLGIYSFLRLIIVACFGNLPTNICRDLIRTVYENLEQWTLNEWMCFMELKRLRKEFTVSIFSMYTVRQSSILAMLGFALNYIVILLQTENYPSSSSSAADNSTNQTLNSTIDSLNNDTSLLSLINETIFNNMSTQMLLESDNDHHSLKIDNPFSEWIN